jgi:glycosyltransferase involved in cell wall biosynthesis
MKIALVYDALFPYVKGGGERRYFELARRLREGHDVHMVSWQYWPGPARTVIDGVTHHGTGQPPAFYGRDGRRRIAEAAAFGARALPVLLRERFDVIDCASVPFLPLFSASLAARVRGARLIATWFEFWDTYWLSYRGGVSGRMARLAERLSARTGDAHIAISQTTADRMAGRRPPRMPVTVIEPGADIDLIRDVSDVSKSVDVVFAGRLNAQKNVELLLRALAEAERSGARITCGIIGDGPERERLEEMARDLALADRVRFHGRIEDDRAYYTAIKGARLFAWPSVAEGFGLAPLEAMACGVPPVIAASTFSATQALVQDGETGVIAAAEPAAFAQAIQRLLNDEPALRAMSAAAVARAERSTWDAMALAVERVYESVVAGGGQPHP